jgi:hypothetical protein
LVPRKVPNIELIVRFSYFLTTHKVIRTNGWLVSQAELVVHALTELSFTNLCVSHETQLEFSGFWWHYWLYSSWP